MGRPLTAHNTQAKAERDRRRQKMLDLYLEGLTLQDIADRLGISRQRVSQIVGPVGMSPVPKTCVSCGAEFLSKLPAKYCRDCHTCQKCGRELGALVGKSRFHMTCDPDYEPKGTSVWTSVEPGIYRLKRPNGEWHGDFCTIIRGVREAFDTLDAARDRRAKEGLLVDGVSVDGRTVRGRSQDRKET